MTALSILSTLNEELGCLDRVERIIKVFGMVNVAPGFNNTPRSSTRAPTSWSTFSATPGDTLAVRSGWRSCRSTSPSRSR